jgi:hypothetical protein
MLQWSRLVILICFQHTPMVQICLIIDYTVNRHISILVCRYSLCMIISSHTV